MKKFSLKVIAFFLSFLSADLIKSIYWNLAGIKLFGKSINDAIIFFIPEKIKLNNHFLFLNQKDVMVSGSIALGLYERYEIEFFLKSLRPEMTVVDIGANIGYYSLLAAPHVKSVLSFEPDPANYGLLVKNIRENNCSNVQTFELAVSDKEGELNLFQNPANFGDRRIYSFAQGSPQVSVKAGALEGFLAKINITQVDFIKMDIQGAEGFALNGMHKILDQPHLQIIMEFFPNGLRMSGFDPINILELLSNKKFQVYHMDIDKKTTDLIEDFRVFTDKFKNMDYANLYCKK